MAIKPPVSRRATFGVALVLSIGWALAFFVQAALAWGFRGEAKPFWFELFTGGVYAAPIVGLLAWASHAWKSVANTQG